MNNLERVFIGIGSNMGRRAANCHIAIEALGTSGPVRIISVSPLYETAPWGVPGQRPFVNVVMEIRSAIGPMALLGLLKSLEYALGRRRGPRWGPRVIDLDLLFFGRCVMDTPALTIPHPRLQKRAFVLLPMAGIAPDFIHPVLGVSMRALLSRLKGGQGMRWVQAEKS